MTTLLYRIECKKCQCGPARCECWYKHPNEKAIQGMIDDWECFMPRPDELFDDAIMEGICRTPDWRYLYAFSSTDGRRPFRCYYEILLQNSFNL